VVLATAVGGDALGTGGMGGVASAARDGGDDGPPGGDAERLHWVGVTTGEGNAPARRGGMPPIAFVIPGRGAPHVTKRVPTGARDRTPRLAARRPPNPERRRTGLPTLTFVVPPELDTAILVAGVLSAAPDFTRVASRPDDFVRRPLRDISGSPLKRPEAGVPGALAAVGRVDELPIALVSNPLPMYPPQLARAGVGGHVLVQFMIDSAGGVDVASLQVINSTNTLFTQAVRSVLPRLHFTPAQVGDRTVGVTVRQPFLFVIRTGS
jgi:protein TonB